MSKLSARLLKSSGASGLSLVARIGEQLLLVPILLMGWGVEPYGEWMMLSALPAYLALSDMGFISAGSNELARRASQEDEASIRRFYGRFVALCCSWTMAFFVVLAVLVHVFPPAPLLGLQRITASEATTTFLLLCASGLFAQTSLAVLSGLRVRGRYHQGLLIRAVGAFARLLVISCVVFFFEAGPIGVAVVTLITNLIAFVVEYIIVARLDLRVVWSTLWRGGEPIRKYIVMGLEYMLLPMANILMLQGMVILVGMTLGAVAVAIFTTHRTLTRLVSSLLQVVSTPLTAEVGLLQRNEDLPELRAAILMISRVTIWVSLMVIALLMISGPWIFESWTRGAVIFHPILFLFLLLATLGETIWRTLAAPRLGTNRHRPLVWACLVFSVTGLFLTQILTPIFGLEGAGMAAALVDIAMGLFTASVTLPMLGITGIGWIRAIAVPPIGEVRRAIMAIMARQKK